MTLLASVVPINCNGGNERQSIHNSRLLTTWFTPVFSQKCWWTVKGRGHPLKFINKPESSCSVSCKQKQMVSCWTALFFFFLWPISKGLYYNLSFGSLACCRLKEIPKGQMEILYLVVITIVEPQGDHIFFFSSFTKCSRWLSVSLKLLIQHLPILATGHKGNSNFWSTKWRKDCVELNLVSQAHFRRRHLCLHCL